MKIGLGSISWCLFCYYTSIHCILSLYYTSYSYMKLLWFICIVYFETFFVFLFGKFILWTTAHCSTWFIVNSAISSSTVNSSFATCTQSHMYMYMCIHFVLYYCTCIDTVCVCIVLYMYRKLKLFHTTKIFVLECLSRKKFIIYWLWACMTIHTCTLTMWKTLLL